MDFSLQLYSARNVKPLYDFIPKLKALGYSAVEGFGGLYADRDGLAAAVRSSGLKMPTGHFGLDQLKDTSEALRTAETLGMTTLFCPAPPADVREGGEAAWTAMAETLAALGETYAAAGFGLGWHNHHWEFSALPSGRLPMDILLEVAPKLVWQCDIAWVVKGKHDPKEWLKRYGSRVVSVHVKDIAPEGEAMDEDGWADVGHGVMDWPGLFAAIDANTSCKSFVMEHDKPTDAERFARRSIASVRAMGK